MLSNTTTERLEAYMRANYKKHVGVCKQGYDFWLYNEDEQPLRHWLWLGRNLRECISTLDERQAIQEDNKCTH